MSLPPQVLALLDDDATPEKAIKAADRGTAIYVDNLLQPYGDDNDARFAWYGMLAAAAIRECEAWRSTDRTAMDRASSAYDALRNWRKA